MRKDTRYYWRLAEALAESISPAGLPLDSFSWATEEAISHANGTLETLLGQAPPHYFAAFLLLWRNEGYRTYSLDTPHCVALLEADPRGLSEETCRLPNSAFAIELPAKTGLEWQGANEVRPATHIFCGVHGRNQLYLQIETKDSVLVDTSDTGATPLEWATGEDSGVEALFDGAFHSDVPSLAKKAIFGSRRLVANLCGMLTTKTATTEPLAAPPRSRKRRHSPEQRLPPSWRITSATIIAHPTASGLAHNGASSATDLQQGSQHRVRGHWRWQACGRNREARRLTWIRPHWRGPGDGEAKTATQMPKTDDEQR